jgi:D-alanyl-D-alanine carboxypeptidase
MRIILLSLFTVACTVFAGAQLLVETADSLRKSRGIPAIAYAVVSADSLYVTAATGYREEGRKATVNRHSLFHIGSNTKAMTGFVAAYLVERGDISWDTRFFDLFPELKKSSRREYRKMTLQQLLSHRTGLRAFTSGMEFMAVPEFPGDKSEVRKAFVEYVLGLAPAESKGSFSYSNAGYSAAAMMLEKAAGKSWELLLSEVFGEKLGMQVITGWPNRYSETQPYGHTMVNGVLTPLGPDNDYDLSRIEPAGDISISIEDYARFIRLNLEGLAGKDNLLKSETYRFLHNCLPDYAIGWGNILGNGKSYSEHAGSAGTFYCYTLIDRAAGKGYIAIANRADETAQQGIEDMIGLLMENVH